MTRGLNDFLCGWWFITLGNTGKPPPAQYSTQPQTTQQSTNTQTLTKVIFTWDQ